MTALTIGLSVYYVFAAFYAIIRLFRGARKSAVYELLIMALLPFTGLPLLLLGRVRYKDRGGDTRFFAEFDQPNVSLYISDPDREQNLTSVKDVLSYNDAHIKRDVVLSIFRSDPEQYISELKIALNDPDTEVSHYASSALTEIKRKRENRILAMRRLSEKNPADYNIVYRYAADVNNYIRCDILDVHSTNKYKRLFCGLISGCMENGIEDTLRQYPDLIDYLTDLNRTDEALIYANLYLKYFPCEASYCAMLKYYYRTRKREKFFSVLDELKKGGIALSSENYEMIRFFGKGGAPDGS